MSRHKSDDVETVYGGMDEGLCAVYCRGHVATGVFIRAAEHYLGRAPEAVDASEDAKGRHFTGADVKREWWRTVPDRGGMFDSRFLKAKPRARGAFPVTVIDLEDWAR
jgi:hypothetical protein